MSKLGFGCNYIKPRLICYNRNIADVKEYWVEEPIYFRINVNSTPLGQYDTSSAKNSVSLKKVSAVTGNVQQCGVVVRYRQKGAKKWIEKTFQAGKAISLTKLKADTVYEWQAQYFIKSKDHNGKVQTIPSSWTKTFKVCTAVTAKPKVKSVKVSGAKVVRHKIAAHWEKNGTHSIRYVKDQIWYTTDFTVTYTFDKPSKNITGYTSDGVYAKAKSKGTKVTFKMSVGTGKKKQKAKNATVVLCSSTNSNGSGLSPKLKYTFKIK